MKQISQKSFEQVMKGIVSDTDAALRDEAPQAYKVSVQVQRVGRVRCISMYFLGFKQRDGESGVIGPDCTSAEATDQCQRCVVEKCSLRQRLTKEKELDYTVFNKARFPRLMPLHVPF